MDEKVVKDLIDRLIDLSFAEDIGDGDHTTLSCIPADAMMATTPLCRVFLPTRWENRSY